MNQHVFYSLLTICEEIISVYLLTKCKETMQYVWMSFLCRNSKAALIPVQLNYGEYPTSWLHGIFGFDLKSGKRQIVCEWKSTDAKVQNASTFLWGIIDHNFYRRYKFILYLFSCDPFFSYSTQTGINVWPNLTSPKIIKTRYSIYVIRMSVGADQHETIILIWHKNSAVLTCSKRILQYNRRRRGRAVCALNLNSVGPWFKSSTLPLLGFVLGNP